VAVMRELAVSAIGFMPTVFSNLPRNVEKKLL
jgi:hypothetical protein